MERKSDTLLRARSLLHGLDLQVSVTFVYSRIVHRSD